MVISHSYVKLPEGIGHVLHWKNMSDFMFDFIRFFDTLVAIFCVEHLRRDKQRI